MSDEINRFAVLELGELVDLRAAMRKYRKKNRVLCDLLDELCEELERKLKAAEAFEKR